MTDKENYCLRTNPDLTYYSELSQAYVLNMFSEPDLKAKNADH